MDDILTFGLKDKIPGGAGLEFLRAEVPNVEDPPVALIRYRLHGEEPETGLRLDLDKQTFLDHFDEQSDQEDVLLRTVPKLISLLYAELDKRDGAEPDYRYEPVTPDFKFEHDSPLADSAVADSASFERPLGW
jgi:hypothetical protein